MIVVASVENTEAMLCAGQLVCPGCAGVMRPHGYGRTRTVRGLGPARVTVRPGRARCLSCAATQVLVPAGPVLRRADTPETIGTALAAKAHGEGHRTLAGRLDRPVVTVRRWLRQARGSHVQWLQEQAVRHAVAADPDILHRRLVWPTPHGDALNLLTGAALSCQRRWDLQHPVRMLVGMFTRGRLLSPPLCT